VWEGAAAQQLLDAREYAQRRGVPQPVDPGASLDEAAGYMPAAVAHGIIQRRAARDGRAGGLDVGASVDQRVGDVDVVAAGCPVQRRFRMAGGS